MGYTKLSERFYSPPKSVFRKIKHIVVRPMVPPPTTTTVSAQNLKFKSHFLFSTTVIEESSLIEIAVFTIFRITPINFVSTALFN